MERSYNRGERRTYLIGNYIFLFYISYIYFLYLFFNGAEINIAYIVFTGESGFFLEPWLLTLLLREPIKTPHFAYNEALCSARNCIERLFGVLKSTWRYLFRHRVLQYEPAFVGRIVDACAVFHNIQNAHSIFDDNLLWH